MGLLRDDQLREIAKCVLSGDTGDEIAANLDVSLRTVRRKIKLIRSTWAAALSRC
jgi:DNA-directed RNA polymerase specialized sigma24 family protein